MIYFVLCTYALPGSTGLVAFTNHPSNPQSPACRYVCTYLDNQRQPSLITSLSSITAHMRKFIPTRQPGHEVVVKAKALNLCLVCAYLGAEKCTF